MSSEPASAFETPIFEALIVPYRSVTLRGVGIVVAALTVISSVVALRFWLLGAWPVAVFSFLELPCVGALLLINLRRARASELIMLTAREIRVIRTDSRGRRKQVSLPSAWLRVDLDAGAPGPRLLLSSHGRRFEVGTFLHEPDKVSLFDALRDALHRARNPRFENPQLRDIQISRIDC